MKMQNREDYIKELKRQYKAERFDRYSSGDFRVVLWNDFLEEKTYQYYKLVFKSLVNEDTK